MGYLEEFRKRFADAPNPVFESAGKLELVRLFEYMYQPVHSTEKGFDSAPTQFQDSPAYKNRIRALLEARQRRI
jgi:hypothetical protein